jgi:hypothetical protein
MDAKGIRRPSPSAALGSTTGGRVRRPFFAMDFWVSVPTWIGTQRTSCRYLFYLLCIQSIQRIGIGSLHRDIRTVDNVRDLLIEVRGRVVWFINK